ncbi:MAG: BtpA/SgcQ family protein [Bacteroidota bacterium]
MFKKILKDEKPVIGMIHISALPGTPQNKLKPGQIIESALKEALIYQNCGLKAVMIENMHDIPYLKSNIGHEISSMMAIIGHEIKQKTELFCGIQILAGANEAALGVALASGIDFIRAEAYVFGHVADEGYIDASAAQLLRYRKHIDAENILVFTDIKKKHSSHAITADVNIVETAKAAEFFLSDGIILTGKSTGEEINHLELRDLKDHLKTPVLIGSGVTDQNIKLCYEDADGFIIGSYFKKDGNWQNPPDPKRIKRLLDVIQTITQ